MGRALTTLLEMLRFRSGPQDLPASRGLTLFFVGLYLSGGFIAGSVLGDSDYAPQSILAIGVQFGIIVVLLRANGLVVRVPQTISALSGTGFLFGMASIVLLSKVDSSMPQPGLVALYFLLFLWSLGVDGHIYRSALSSKMGTGVLVAVIIFSINFMLISALFG